MFQGVHLLWGTSVTVVLCLWESSCTGTMHAGLLVCYKTAQMQLLCDDTSLGLLRFYCVHGIHLQHLFHLH